MTLARFLTRFNTARRFVDGEGRLTREAYQLINDLLNSVDDNAVQANTDIADAGEGDAAGSYWVMTPASQAWNTDTSGVHEAGNPVQDILYTAFDANGSAVATRTLRGTLTSATGLVTVTEVGTPTGLTTTVNYDPVTNADATVRATVTTTFVDGTQSVGEASWSAVDLTVAGGTPGSGAGK